MSSDLSLFESSLCNIFGNIFLLEFLEETSARVYSMYFQINRQDPWKADGIDFATYIKLKHSKVFPIEYVKDLLDKTAILNYDEDIEVLRRSIDGIDYEVIFAKDEDVDEVSSIGPAETNKTALTASTSGTTTMGPDSPTPIPSIVMDKHASKDETQTFRQRNVKTKFPLGPRFKPTQPKKSSVWTYFVKTQDGGQCKLCHKDVKSRGNTTNLTNHILRNHKNDKTPKLIRENTQSSIQKNNLEIDPDDPVVATVSTQRDTHCQPRIDTSVSRISSFKNGGSKASAITNALIYMIAKDDLPINTTEKTGFKYYSSVATPLYDVPKRTAITAAIDRKYEVLSALMKEKFLQIANVTLTADIWTETMNTQSFLGCTAHFLDDDKLLTVALDTVELNERHTSAYIQGTFKSICETWNIELEKVSAIVTDSGANVLKAACDTFGSNRHLACFAHSLNLVFTRVIDGTEPLKELITKIKVIVTYFKHSTPAADELRKSQVESSQLRLIQNVSTRWNSTFYMLERFLVLIDPISSILLKLPKSPPLLTADEIATVRDTVRVLQPAEMVTKDLSGQNYVTTSKIIPTVYCLKKSIEGVKTTSEIVENFKNAILKELDKRFKGIELNPLTAIANILDPRLKRMYFSSALSCAKLIEKVNVLVKQSKLNKLGAQHQQPEKHLEKERERSGNDNDVWKFHTELVNQHKNYDTETSTSGGLDVDLKQYLANETIPLNADPIKYWIDRKENTPGLASIALKYLSTVASSTPCERLFSMAGNIATPNRNKLSGKHLSRLLFLKSLEFEKWRM
ncbi:E3 SUMO-protein ligase ZBED1-like isoform X1 [Venturia canescens]|uniref:E3 SUMO-protein ligase ZBED1-like isoform X1 n=2 Tax=Venturia canescens TaxID=32260 RepID=UPI001C9C26ED|nr:E3 SUMO-protein ligase ZBED1-like isoform X1 [Venturia canescens]XP_043285285.1 E3 SUMO-protein ligase ZBED1-like isoform X1 [Venturia canescens]